MMKRIYNIGLILCSLLIATKGYSFDFEVDGLCYNKLSESTVELTWKSVGTPYTGDVVVPSSVNYNGKKYAVVAIGEYAMVEVEFSSNNEYVSLWGTNSKLISVSLPSALLSINNFAFLGCNGLTSITIPNSVTSIGISAFRECSSLTSITIPNSVTNIGNYAFYQCSSLTSITIPNSVTSIGKYAFEWCSGLTSITIPNSVTNIGDGAFIWCSGLTDVISEIQKPFEIAESVFSSSYSKATLTVPYGTKSKYQQTNYWNKFANIVETEADNAFGKVADVVDLGLSVKWASWNVGASKIGDYGGLYGAGDPTGQKTSHNVGEYYYKEGESICGTDNDLAHVKWGESWRMPTFDELIELKEKCLWEENIMIDGVKGSMVTGQNGNKLFIPYAGSRSTPNIDEIVSRGSLASLWSGDLLVSSPTPRYKDLDIINDGTFRTDGGDIFFGQSIRPVYDDSGSTKPDVSPKRTIHVDTAGTLPNLISDSEKYTIEELTLTGELNGTDFRLLRDMAGVGDENNDFNGGQVYTNGKLKVLDISEVTIKSGGACYLHYQYKDYRNDCFVESDSEIPSLLFSGCKLKTILLPNSVLSIKESAFEDCHSLRSVYIGINVSTIEKMVFYGCSNLISIDVDVRNQYFQSVNGVLFNKNQTTLINYPRGKEELRFEIPNSVTTITERALESCKFETVVIPNSVTAIGTYAFWGGNLNTIISEIEKPFEISSVFFSRSNCTLYVPKGTKALYEATRGWNEFDNIVESSGGGSSTSRTIHVYPAGSLPTMISETEKYTIEELTLTGELNGTDFRLLRDMAGNNYLGQRTEGKLKKLDLTGAKVVAGGEKYLDTDEIIGNSVRVVGSFHYQITQANEIPERVFCGCCLTNILIPNTVTNIGFSSFFDCSGLTSITIPNSVTSIREEAFSGCSGLTSITIPNSVTSIGNLAFYGCSGLTDVISEIQNPFEIKESVFSSDTYSKATLTVPSGTKTKYQQTNHWNKFANIVEQGSQTGITVTVNNATREYGDANPTFGYTVSGGTLNGTPHITCSATKTSSVGTYTINIAKGSVTNSNVTFVNGTLTITKAPLTITAKSCTKKQGEANPTFEVTYNGFKNNEDESVLTKKPTVSTSATTNSGVGNYVLTPSGAEAMNYSFTYVTGTLTIVSNSTGSFTWNGITYTGNTSTLQAEVQSVSNDVKNVEIPSSLTYSGTTYQVTSIASGALSNHTFNYVSLPSTITSIANNTFSNTTMGALIWNANSSLSSSVFSNMAMSTTSENFLLYVNSRSYAPSNVSNVIVNGTATSIKLADADGTNTMFYCPKEFTAQSVTYTHNYSMTTGGGKGWETLALPFNVAKIEHATKGELTPFYAYTNPDTQRPFWLFEFGSSGFKRTGSIKANTPYIIAMPNSTAYDDEYILSGNVTFSATNAKVVATESLVTASYNAKTFIPNFSVIDKASSVYPLNVSNSNVSTAGGYDYGSRFISNLRKVYPFEAYMTTSSASRAIAIDFEDGTTGMDDIVTFSSGNNVVKVYSLSGLLLFMTTYDAFSEKWSSLPTGVYIVNGKKMMK